MRVCFHLRVLPEKLEEYRQIHANPPKELLEELRKAGIRNYSIFLWESGNEFGFLECDDWAEVQDRLSKSSVMTKWEEVMREYLATPVTPGQSPILLEEVFRLD